MTTNPFQSAADQLDDSLFGEIEQEQIKLKKKRIGKALSNVSAYFLGIEETIPPERLARSIYKNKLFRNWTRKFTRGREKLKRQQNARYKQS